jgi:hypothetical protein
LAKVLERRVVADLRHRNIRQHREVGEGRAAHVVMKRLAAEREAARAVGHHTLALCRADRRAEVGFARQAGFALPAFGRVERDGVVPAPEAGDAGTDVDDNARTLVAEDRRKEAFRIRARARELVGVADAGGLDLDQYFAGLRAVETNGLEVSAAPAR